MSKSLNEYSRKELLSLPLAMEPLSTVEFGSLILIPGTRKHGSGYGVITIIGVKDGIPWKRLATHPDVLNINGIGALRDQQSRP